MQQDSYEGNLPNREPQAPKSISVESVDRSSRPAPLNPGSEPHGGNCTEAGEPRRK